MTRTQEIITAIIETIEELELELEELTNEEVVNEALNNGFFECQWDRELGQAQELVESLREAQ